VTSGRVARVACWRDFCLAAQSRREECQPPPLCFQFQAYCRLAANDVPGRNLRALSLKYVAAVFVRGALPDRPADSDCRYESNVCGWPVLGAHQMPRSALPASVEESSRTAMRLPRFRRRAGSETDAREVAGEGRIVSQRRFVTSLTLECATLLRSGLFTPCRQFVHRP
jgi:hypothetical protein